MVCLCRTRHVSERPANGPRREPPASNMELDDGTKCWAHTALFADDANWLNRSRRTLTQRTASVMDAVFLRVSI